MLDLAHSEGKQCICKDGLYRNYTPPLLYKGEYLCLPVSRDPHHMGTKKNTKDKKVKFWKIIFRLAAPRRPAAIFFILLPRKSKTYKFLIEGSGGLFFFFDFSNIDILLLNLSLESKKRARIFAIFGPRPIRPSFLYTFFVVICALSSVATVRKSR